ncbi:hypothetical protein HanIR_Chr01g0013581 [Helianthus annuus]|nr:hypothetical protein HanIR_Chr01g0013581 [Helianthus annuus]
MRQQQENHPGSKKTHTKEENVAMGSRGAGCTHSIHIKKSLTFYKFVTYLMRVCL